LQFAAKWRSRRFFSRGIKHFSMDGACHVIPFFGNDDVVRVRDTHVPNENVHVIYLARKMIGLKKA